MKRLVWLLLAAFCTAVAQVQPVDVQLVPAQKCDCCADGNDCDMPDCGLPPSAGQMVASLTGSVASLRVAAKRQASVAHVEPVAFYERFVAPARVAPTLSVNAALAPPASVPLFREHCSLLI